MFRWFEERIDPFSEYDRNKAIPSTIGAFFREMLWPVRWPIAVATALSACAAIAEILMFSFMQRLVDMLGTAEPAALWQDYGNEIIIMAVVALMLKPALELLGATVQNLSYLTPVG